MESKKLIGWIFVATQAVLVIALVLLSPKLRADQDWPTPPAVQLAGYLVIAIGFAIMAAAALRLGTSLTPTPIPKNSGTLTTAGLYKYARHPIYTGVLTTIAGLTLRSGSLLTLGLALASMAFFTAKAIWEEKQLAATYSGYTKYAARTARFFPTPWRRHEGNATKD